MTLYRTQGSGPSPRKRNAKRQNGFLIFIIPERSFLNHSLYILIEKSLKHLCSIRAQVPMSFLSLFFSLLLSYHRLRTTRFRSIKGPQQKLKKVGQTTRPFRYELNKVSYDYTVQVRNRFKGLDLIGRVPEELWMEVCNIVQEMVTKTIHKKKKCKKAKWFSEAALQIAEKRREVKGKGEKER